MASIPGFIYSFPWGSQYQAVINQMNQAAQQNNPNVNATSIFPFVFTPLRSDATMLDLWDIQIRSFDNA